MGVGGILVTVFGPIIVKIGEVGTDLGPQPVDHHPIEAGLDIVKKDFGALQGSSPHPSELVNHNDPVELGPQDHRISLDATVPSYGGRRRWLLCPVRG